MCRAGGAKKVRPAAQQTRKERNTGKGEKGSDGEAASEEGKRAGARMARWEEGKIATKTGSSSTSQEEQRRACYVECSSSGHQKCDDQMARTDKPTEAEYTDSQSLKLSEAVKSDLKGAEADELTASHSPRLATVVPTTYTSMRLLAALSHSMLPQPCQAHRTTYHLCIHY